MRGTTLFNVVAAEILVCMVQHTQCAQGVKHRMHVAWDINGKHLHALLHTDLEAPLEHKPIRNAVFLKLPMHQKEHLCRACKDRVDLSLLA